MDVEHSAASKPRWDRLCGHPAGGGYGSGWFLGGNYEDQTFFGFLVL